MDRSIAEGPAPPFRADARDLPARTTVVAGAILVVLFLALYVLTRPAYQVVYNHFVWQADAFLHGRAAIDYPVAEGNGQPGNAFFNDVVPVVNPDGSATGLGMIPFPPLPAIVLLPFVAAWGIATDEGLITALLGALDVALAFWLLGRLPIRPSVRAAMTIFAGAGAALWYAASIGTTWFLAHVVAVGLLFAALAIALEADQRRRDRDPAAVAPLLDGRQVLAGFLIGLAATSRLTVAFGVVFLLFVGGGSSWLRRGLAAGVGVAIPVACLLAYNLAVSGTLFNPVYDQLYRYEVIAYPELHYNAGWALQDLRYIPQNLGIMLLGSPTLMPACDPDVSRTLWSAQGCSWVVPRQVGMSFVLASPAWLLALAAPGWLSDRRVLGAFVATALIATVNLMHFSQGWVQFGYRFSLDFAPFLLVATALGAEALVARHGTRALRGGIAVGGLVAASVAIQAWGIAWARTLQW